MRNQYTTACMSKAADAFLGMKSPADLAALLKLNTGELIMAIRKIRYAQLQIPAGKGRTRSVFQPDYELCKIQRRLNHYLQAVYFRVKPGSVYGFVKSPADQSGRFTIVTHARNHVGQQYVINADIFRFFPSIKGDAVREVFLRAPFGFDLQLASAVALLCLCRNWLPTGAPTSPVISNLVCLGLDRELSALARNYGYVYTRYADDLTFSGDVHPEADRHGEAAQVRDRGGEEAPVQDRREVTGESEVCAGGSEGSTSTLDPLSLGGGGFRQALEAILNRHGFQLNRKKYRVQSRRSRQTVTGLTVNEKVNVSRDYLRKLRAIRHNKEVRGTPDAAAMYFGRPNPDLRDLGRFLQILEGKTRYVEGVRGGSRDEKVFIGE